MGPWLVPVAPTGAVLRLPVDAPNPDQAPFPKSVSLPADWMGGALLTTIFAGCSHRFPEGDYHLLHQPVLRRCMPCYRILVPNSLNAHRPLTTEPPPDMHQ